MQLDRDDLIEGLRDVVRAVHEQKLSGVSIRIVGGGALRLAHFDRDTTAEIAAARGWPSDWLNNSAAIFIPNLGQTVDWEPLLDDSSVSIAIAPMNALLAMKLAAARPGRDPEDIAKLLALSGIETVAAAEELFESFYPGDALPDRTIALVERIFAVGLPPKPPSSAKPNLS